LEKSQLADDVLRQTAELLFNLRQKHTAADAFFKGEMFILNYMARKRTAVLPGELSAAMNSSSARIAMALRSMEQKGYIRRDLDRSDRRKILVTITPKGWELQRSKSSAMRAAAEALVGELGEDDARTYIRIAGRINEIVKTRGIEI